MLPAPTLGPTDAAASQGVVYLIVITLGYLIASAFLIANLNDAVSQAPNVFARASRIAYQSARAD